MTSGDLVSVIVPVYNVKDYLEECFASVCAQTYGNVEIILVDDGSTDGSGELCDELASRDDRAVVVHKVNGGLSDARNAGLRFARGNWISFVDSDDYISPVFIEVLLGAAVKTSCEISAVPFGTPFKDGEPCPLAENADLHVALKCLPSEAVQRLMLYQALDTGAQWRLYSKKSLGADPFPVGLYYEDLASIYKIIRKVDYVAVVECRALYAYRLRGDSIIRQGYKHIKGESAIRIATELYSDISTWYPSLTCAVASRCFSLCRMVFAQIPWVSSKGPSCEFANDSEMLWEVLKMHRKAVLLDPRARKRERLAAAIAYLGQDAFASFCHLCRRLGKMQ